MLNGDRSRAAAPASEGRLSEAQRELVHRFAEQIVACYDPEVVAAFLEWRRDPRLESILQLAARLGDDDRDQLLFFAEEAYAASELKPGDLPLA